MPTEITGSVVVLCKACRFYTAGSNRTDERNACSRWRYGYGQHPLNAANDIIVERDEGWGADMGPEFGCVLGELKEATR